MKSFNGYVCAKFNRTVAMMTKIMVISSLGLGCKPAPEANGCKKDFTKTVEAVKITNGKAYFDLKQLLFLIQTPNLTISDIDLIVDVEGPNDPEIDFDVAFNGLKTNRRDHHRCADRDDFDHDKNRTRSHVPAHKLYMGGTIHLLQFIIKMMPLSGNLRIDISHYNKKDRRAPAHERKPKIQSVQLVFTGYTTDKANCTTPPPPPPPPPPVEDPSAFAPKINSVNPILNPTTSNNMVISFSAAQTGGTFYCSLDQQEPVLCQSPAIYQDLTNGSHTFTVRAQTPSGKVVSATDSYTWVVDHLAPLVTIANREQLPIISRNSFIEFSLVSSEEGSTFRCKLDQDNWSDCPSPMSYAALTEGPHHFEVVAVDALGNTSPTPSVFDWTIDQTPPQTKITEVQPASSVSSSDQRMFIFSASESAKFECSLDQQEFMDCSSPITLTQLPEGSHTLQIRATDLAGWTGPTVSTSWSNDYTAPVIGLESTLPAIGLTNTHELSVHFNATESVTFTCAWNGIEQPCSSPFTQSLTEEGPHQLIISARDEAQNESAPVELNWLVDWSAPVISFGAITPSSAAAINNNHLQLEILGAPAEQLNIQLNDSDLPAQNPISLASLPEGFYSVTVTATDSAGNASNTITHNFAVDLTPPQIEWSDSGSNPSAVDAREVRLTSNEPVAWACNLDEAGFADCVNPVIYTALADGAHTLNIKARDPAGNEASLSHSWVIDTVAPATTLSAQQLGRSISFALQSNESPVTFECALNESAWGPCDTSVHYGNLTAGSYVFQARARDQAGNLDPNGATHSFLVLEPIQTLLLSTTPSAPVTNSTSMSLEFTASRPAASYLCTFDGVSVAHCAPPYSIDELSEGAHSFFVQAVDEFGDRDPVGVAYSWTVDTIAPTPSTPLLSIGVNSIIVTWTTNEPATSQVEYGIGGVATINRATNEDTVLKTNHSVTLTGLTSNTLYSLRVKGRDQAGNAYIGTALSARTRR